MRNGVLLMGGAAILALAYTGAGAAAARAAAAAYGERTGTTATVVLPCGALAPAALTSVREDRGHDRG